MVSLLPAQHSQMFNKRLGFQKIAEPVEMKSAYKSWYNSSQSLTKIPVVKEGKIIYTEISPESWRNLQQEDCVAGLTQ